MERNENNLINQLLQDETIEEKKTWIEYVNDIYDIYINSRNNEKDSSFNSEDERAYKDKVFKASDFSLKVNEQNELEIGHCMRESFFRYKNSYQDNVPSKQFDEIEKNILYKEQYLRKLRLCSLIEEKEKIIFEIQNIKIESTEDAFIMDYQNQKEYLLFIKPVNDSVSIIKNKLFSKFKKPIPLSYHIPEIILNMYIHKKPAKILYIGKNNSDLITEFNFGFLNGNLTINNELHNEIKLKTLISSLSYLSFSIEKDILPNKIFTDRILSNEEINEMREYGLIEDFELDRLLNGNEYKNFQCNTCKYKTTCNNFMEETNE